MLESIARPTGVTLVVALTLVSGLLDVIAGTVKLVQTGSDPETDVLGGASPLVGSGVFLLVFGVLLLIISVWLWRGRPAARVAVTVLEGLSIVGAVFLALASPNLLLVSILTVAVAVVVIALLWTGRATAFFHN